MTNFVFPEYGFKYDLKKFKKEEKENIQLIKNLNFKQSIKSNYIEKSELTIHLEDFLEFLLNKKIQIELPPKVEITYFDFDVLEQLKYQLLHSDNSIVQYFSQKFLSVDYVYPACSNLETNTIYICNHFKFEENEKLSYLKNRFNGNSKQVLEYVFSHELGHLFLLEKNKHNINNNQDELLTRLARNVEEAFAESFAIQLLCIKYSNLANETKNFEYLKNNNIEVEQSAIIRVIQQKPKKYSNIVKLFDIYEYPEIYKNLPFKDQNGDLEINIDKIYENCFDLALKNNRQVILNKLNNVQIKELNIDIILIDKIKESLKIKKIINEEELITKIHNEFQNKGFLKIMNNIKNFKTSTISTNKKNKPSV